MPKFMKALAVVLLILMLIGSFILGDTYKVPNQRSLYGTVEYQYNAAIALYGVILSFIVFGLLYSIGYALERLDGIWAETSKTNQILAENAAHHSHDDSAPEQNVKRAFAPTSQATAPRSSLDESHTPTTVSVQEPEARDEKEYIVNRSQSEIVCPNCQTKQKSNRLVCFYCGAHFKSSDQDNSDQTVSVTRKNFTFSCPLCGCDQSSRNDVCQQCGVHFTETTQA